MHSHLHGFSCSRDQPARQAFRLGVQFLENYAHVKEALVHHVSNYLCHAHSTKRAELDAEFAAVCQLITAEHENLCS
jgi:hypothetical protein